jgi:hypothetical protein
MRDLVLLWFGLWLLLLGTEVLTEGPGGGRRVRVGSRVQVDRKRVGWPVGPQFA